MATPSIGAQARETLEGRTQMTRQIILGYDPDHEGDSVLRLGRIICEVVAARPLVVTALPWPHYLMGLEDLQRRIDAEMAEPFALVSEQLADLEVETRAIASGTPAAALHELAESEGAEMIVIGSCHHGPVGRTLAGSVGESLMSGAACAVAVAPRGYGQVSGDRLLKLAVAFDGSAESWKALETAIGIAERCHAEVAVLTVADYATYGYASAWSILSAGEFRDLEHEEKERLLELALSRVPAGLAREGRVLVGSAGEQLAEASGDFDLMVVGSRAYGPLRRTLLGSTTRKLIRAAGCPVVALPRGVGVDPLGLRSPIRGIEAAAGPLPA